MVGKIGQLIRTLAGTHNNRHAAMREEVELIWGGHCFGESLYRYRPALEDLPMC